MVGWNKSGLGTVERESGRLILQVLNKRDSSTLILIVRKWVHLNTSCATWWMGILGLVFKEARAFKSGKYYLRSIS